MITAILDGSVGHAEFVKEDYFGLSIPVSLNNVDDNVLNKRINDAKKITGNKPKVYKDYRRMLENKDIDAVVIGTPDHWHCLNLVDTLDSGKHAYCEKPLSNSIEEAYIMLDASKKSDKCVQSYTMCF